MQSGIVWPPIWYATPCAASLRYRNRAEIFVLICEQKPYPLWFSIPRKTYPVKGENSLNLTLPTIMLPNTSSSSDDITTRPWVREIITSSSNDIKKKKADPFIYLFQESSRVFFIGDVSVKCTRPKGKRKQTNRKSSNRFSSTRLVLTYHEVWGYINTARDEFSTGWKFVSSGVPFTRNFLSRRKI